jgi:hypothetical protein
MAREPSRLVKCPTCQKEVHERGLHGHLLMSHGINTESERTDLSSTQVVSLSPTKVITSKEEKTMGDCPHCTAREIEMNRYRNEVIPGLKIEHEKQIKELTGKNNLLAQQLSEKPTADAMPEDLNEVITHCESGQCSSHSRQWASIKAQIVEAKKPAIIQATLENLPDSVVEAEGLKRGFIPRQIIIPIPDSKSRLRKF